MRSRLLLLIGVMVALRCAIGLVVYAAVGPSGGDVADGTANGGSQDVRPDAVDAALRAAEQYVAAREFGNAEVILATLIERAPEDVRGREMLARVWLARAAEALGRGDAPEAERGYREAYRQYAAAAGFSPEPAGLHQNAAELALMLGEPERAVPHLIDAEAREPDNPKHALYLGLALAGLDRLDEATAAFQRVLAIDPEQPVALTSLASIAVEQGRLDEALERITLARTIDPEDLAIRLQHARILRHRGDARQGLELLVGLPEDQKTTEAVTAELAACFGALGDHGAAARLWERYSEEHPESPRAWHALVQAGQAHLDAGDLPAARMALMRARMLAPQEPDVQTLAERIEHASP